MGHFARVVNGIVKEVIKADVDFINNYQPLNELLKFPSQWIECSYYTKGNVYYNEETNLPDDDQTKRLRANYPSEGYIYDSNNDVFYSPSPFPSWNLNTGSYEWEPPIPKPDNCSECEWNEINQNWV